MWAHVQEGAEQAVYILSAQLSSAQLTFKNPEQVILNGPAYLCTYLLYVRSMYKFGHVPHTQLVLILSVVNNNMCFQLLPVVAFTIS